MKFEIKQSLSKEPLTMTFSGVFTICLYSFRRMASGWTPSVVPHPWRKKSIDSFTEPHHGSTVSK